MKGTWEVMSWGEFGLSHFGEWNFGGKVFLCPLGNSPVGVQNRSGFCNLRYSTRNEAGKASDLSLFQLRMLFIVSDKKGIATA